MEPKQVIVIRRDLGMRRGKEISQGAHGAMMWLSKRLTTSIGNDHVLEGHFKDYELRWLRGLFTKITLQVADEVGLLELHERAKKAGIANNWIVEDAGRTEFKGIPTKTCLAIGPDMPDKIDAVTGELKPY